MKMRQFYFMVLLTLSCCISVKAQVTIGSAAAPNTNALLDLQMNQTDGSSTKGVLMPRVALTAKDNPAPLAAFVKGMIVYNTSNAGTGNTRVRPGFYYSDGTSEWKRLSYLNEGDWFFLPTAAIDVTQTVTDRTINLYDIYEKNMVNYAGTVKNPGAPADILMNVHGASDLDYYVTDYDASVFTISGITDAGVMTYSVDATAVTDNTFINIVLRVK